MKTLDILLLIAYVVTNAFALVQLIGSYRWPTFTRVVFFLLFAGAAILNVRTVFDTPWSYQSYADYAIPLYSRFIFGSFDMFIRPIVLSIVVGQVFIAGSMLMKGFYFQEGCFFGMVFCVAIAPLGLGAAFPATLLMALAFYRLYKHESRTTVGDVISQIQFPLPVD